MISFVGVKAVSVELFSTQCHEKYGYLLVDLNFWGFWFY